jgi:hypothetical protein
MTDMSINGLESAGRATPADLAANGARPAVTTDVRGTPRAAAADNARRPIGYVLDVSGAGSSIALDLTRLEECMVDGDPSISLAGQVGSQLKIRVGGGWLLDRCRQHQPSQGTVWWY